MAIEPEGRSPVFSCRLIPELASQTAIWLAMQNCGLTKSGRAAMFTPMMASTKKTSIRGVPQLRPQPAQPEQPQPPPQELQPQPTIRAFLRLPPKGSREKKKR